MADSLDKRLENSPETKTLNPDSGTEQAINEKKPESIDDVIESGERFDTGTSGVPMTGSKLWKILKTALLVGTGYGAAQLLFHSGMSALYMAGAFAVGNILEKKILKQKWTLDHFLKDIYTGALLAAPSLGIYTLPDMISPGGLINKIAKWGMFAFVAAPPWIYGYRIFNYFRDRIGWKKAYEGIKDGKIFRYFKKAHKREFKEVLPGVKTAILNFGPSWFYSMNYLRNPASRLILGNFNDVFARFFLGGKGVRSENMWVSLYNAGKSLSNKMYSGLRNSVESLREKLLSGYEGKYSPDYKLA